MKRILTMLLFLFSATRLFAAEPLTFGPVLRISNVKHATEEWYGLRMGWKETDDFAVGGMYLTSIPKSVDPRVGPTNSRLESGTLPATP